jgi:hypothetical protein
MPWAQFWRVCFRHLGWQAATERDGSPSNRRCKDAFLHWCNHNPDGTPVAEKVTAKFFKKEACDNPTN